MITHPPRGLIADLVTPLDEERRPDRAGILRIMGRLSGQVAGFLAGGVRAGEALDLRPADRLEVLAAALEGAGEGQALLFEITARTREETVSLLEGAENLLKSRRPRATVFYLLTPLIYHGNRDLPQHLQELVRTGRRPLVLSNNPGLVGRIRARLRHENIRTHVLKKLAANEQMVGLDFDGSLDRALNYQRAVGSRANFRFYDGNEANFLERPSSSGLISIGACLMPQAWSDIVNMSLGIFESRRLNPEQMDQVWASGRAVRSLLALYRSNPPAVVKTALKMMKVIEGAAMANEAEGLDTRQIWALEAGLKELRLI